MDRKKFEIIEGGKAEQPIAKPKRKPRAKTGPIWYCRPCVRATGLELSTFIRVTTRPMDLGDRLVGGKPGWICANCLARGVVTHQTV